ncbi:hypothetical protein C2D64_08505 [Listeria ivanovii]|uniref:AAA family ATPase n=1 Tax=Listeria ivanovii TaxID=1638 RepID=UPI000DA84384|nr:DUF3696 domain-containing protein [Listeria ivanovii]PZG33374.1 hypothetical protein C2D64_08505 [Listeria ivanovii]PZG47119.1 hypothetical protein C2D66_08215 [Listeria ivanovii]PZH11025.1 hypothetical protein C2D65_08455 [Listeria ivanovii]
MNQITTLQISGLKSYLELSEITLSQLNVFSGVNSVGKSTAIQSILLTKLLHDNYINDKNVISETYLNNQRFGLELGIYEKIITGTNNYFEFGINNKLIQIEAKKGDSLKVQANMEEILKNTNVNLFDGHFYYLSAERVGPRNYQVIDSYGIDNCGIRGENAFHILNKYSENLIDEDLLFPDTKTKAEKTLKKQTEKWLNTFFDGVEFSSTLDNALRLVKLEVKQSTHDMGYVSLNNVGFGLSYVLPILLTCLTSKENSLIVIENPEAHLHPKGQSRLGQFLAQVSSSKRQVIVETHSEHIINGMRLFYLKNNIHANKLTINFFSIKNSKTNIKKIALNERMELLEWPDDFFDQQENDLRSMREIRRRHE